MDTPTASPVADLKAMLAAARSQASRSRRPKVFMTQAEYDALQAWARHEGVKA